MSEIKLSVRLNTVFFASGYKDLTEFLKLPDSVLINTKGFGIKSLEEVYVLRKTMEIEQNYFNTMLILNDNSSIKIPHELYKLKTIYMFSMLGKDYKNIMGKIKKLTGNYNTLKDLCSRCR